MTRCPACGRAVFLWMNPLLTKRVPWFVGLGAFLCPALGRAQDVAHSINREASGLQFWDWTIIAGYLCIVLGMGWFYSRRQSDNQEYFIAGQRHIHPILIGISLYATLLSTISYLGKPGEMINRGPMLLIGQIMAVPISFVVVGYFIIPRLMRERVTSAYELLEQRLGVSARLLGAGLFVGLRLIWMGLLIYLTSVALVVIIGLELKWTPWISLVTGLVAVIYTSMGGLRTVVITDVFQFGLLFLGALLGIVIVTINLKGFGWIPTEWSPHWDRQPWFSLDPHVRVTMFGTIVSLGLWQIATAGGDQTAVQRFMATSSARAARRSYLINAMAVIVVTVVQAFLGLALLGFYTRIPDALGPGMTVEGNGDHLFPYFIAHHLPVGLSGLVVSAVIAAAMSSIDSGVNSITAVVIRDFLPRLRRRPTTAAAEVRFSKWIAFGIGSLVVLASLFMQYVPGNFVEMTSRTANLLVVPIFMLFVFALWVPFATPLGVLLGTAYGLVTATFIGFWDGLTGGEPLSFQWMGAGALVVNLAVGLAISRFGPARENVRDTRRIGAIGTCVLAAIVFVLIR